MAESFTDLFEESLNTIEMAPGSIVTGTVVEIDSEVVIVHAGLKSEGVIPRTQFINERGEFSLEVGDQVKVAMEAVDDGWGATRLSREKARRAECWQMLEDAFDNGKAVEGVMNGRVKGGFTVDINDIRAFLPGSLVDVRPLRETAHLEGKPLDFKVIKLDQKRNNVVVSRRAVLEQENSAEREALLASLQEGQEIKGVVKNLTDYGAFVDLGGVDGLLHITDMAWRRIRHPSEVVTVGDDVNVKILKFDREKNRVSLGMKQLGDDPWVDLTRRYPEGTRVPAVVTNLTDYGCFAEIEEGVEGLVHVSEMDWTNKNVHPSKVVAVGDEVEVMVLDINEERRRISLGIKQLDDDAFTDYVNENVSGSIVTGEVITVEPREAVLRLAAEVEGVLKASEIGMDRVDDARNVLKPGDELSVKIINVDRKNRYLGLSIKAKEQDEERANLREHRDREADRRRGPTTLGDLIKRQMDRSAEQER